MEEKGDSAPKRRLFWVFGAIAMILVLIIVVVVAIWQSSNNWDPIISEVEVKKLCQVDALPFIEKAFVGETYAVIDPEKEQFQTYEENDGLSRYDTPVARLGWYGKNYETDQNIVFVCLAGKNQKGVKEVLALFAKDGDNTLEIAGNVLTAFSTKDEEGDTTVSEDWMVRTCQKEYKSKVDAMLPGIEYDFINTKSNPRTYHVSDEYRSPYGSPVVLLSWYGVNNTEHKVLRFSCYAAKASRGEDKLLYLTFSNGAYESKDVYGTLRDVYDDKSWVKLKE